MKNFKRQSALIGGLLMAMNASAAWSSTTFAKALIDWNSLKIRTLGFDANPTYTLANLSSNSSAASNSADWQSWDALTSTRGKLFGASTSGDGVGSGSASANRGGNLTVSGSGFLMIAAKYQVSAGINGISCQDYYCYDQNAATASVGFDLVNTSNGGNNQSHALQTVSLGGYPNSGLITDKKEGILSVGVMVNNGDILSFSSAVSASAREVFTNPIENPTSSSGYTLVNFPYSITLTAVPLPGAVWLFGSAAVGLLGLSRQRRSATA